MMRPSNSSGFGTVTSCSWWPPAEPTKRVPSQLLAPIAPDINGRVADYDDRGVGTNMNQTHCVNLFWL